MARTWRHFLGAPWVAELLVLLAGALYLAQSWIYAHTRESILDEGAYLYKGYLFVTGQYAIYQDYGTWSNHMPLSFYIPGYAQLLFGPGLRTGRYLAVVLGLLFLIGLWVLVRRVGGRWWAAVAVWVFAINPVVIKMYSVMVSQVLIACMLVWVLVLVLGESRSLWQIGLGSALAGAMMMTRINLAPVLPLLVLYVFWQHGRKAGLLATVVGGLTVVIGHALFWPNILRMWAFWIPESFTPFLDPWRPPPDAIPYWEPDIGLAGRVASFFLSFRVSFVALVGVFTAWLLWPRQDQWKKTSSFRSAVFLSSLFLILLLAHMWATLGQNYCVYCLPGYTTFFAASGLVLICISFPTWRKQLPWWYQLIIVIIVLTIATGIGYGAFEDLDDFLLDLEFPKFIFGYPISSGSERLGKLLVTTYQTEVKQLRRLLPAIAGFVAGILTLLIASVVTVIFARQRKLPRPAFGYWALVVFLLAGTLLSPTQPLGGGYRFYECSGDVILSYEVAGEHLARTIPPGSRVYWNGGQSAVPLIYLPDIKIYPPQINAMFSKYYSRDLDGLLRFGFWNDELARQWAKDADIILIQQRNFKGWLIDVVNSDSFEELKPSPQTANCREDAQIRIFRRKSRDYGLP